VLKLQRDHAPAQTGAPGDAPSRRPKLPDDINRPRETAERLGVSVATLNRWRAVGCGPRFVRLSPRAIGYLEREIVAFTHARSFVSIADADAGTPSPTSAA